MLPIVKLEENNDETCSEMLSRQTSDWHAVRSGSLYLNPYVLFFLSLVCCLCTFSILTFFFFYVFPYMPSSSDPRPFLSFYTFLSHRYVCGNNEISMELPNLGGAWEKWTRELRVHIRMGEGTTARHFLIVASEKSFNDATLQMPVYEYNRTMKNKMTSSTTTKPWLLPADIGMSSLTVTGARWY